MTGEKGAVAAVLCDISLIAWPWLVMCTYTERGTVSLELADNVTFTDGYFLDAAALEAGQKPLIVTGIEAVSKAIMESENDSFDALNTELVIENGKVVDIVRCYTP